MPKRPHESLANFGARLLCSICINSNQIACLLPTCRIGLEPTGGREMAVGIAKFSRIKAARVFAGVASINRFVGGHVSDRDTVSGLPDQDLCRSRGVLPLRVTRMRCIISATIFRRDKAHVKRDVIQRPD